MAEPKTVEQKKAYTQPTLTEYGKVEKETKGLGGDTWEVYGGRDATENPNAA
jgi:hypothetical protein